VAFRGDEVGKTAVRSLVAVVCLLSQEAETRAVEDDVVAVGARGPEAVDAAGTQEVVACDLAQHGQRIVVELARCRLVQDRRELALQIPRVEEELPVDERHELGGFGRDVARAGERRSRQGRRRDLGPGPTRLRAPWPGVSPVPALPSATRLPASP